MLNSIMLNSIKGCHPLMLNSREARLDVEEIFFNFFFHFSTPFITSI